jgi:S-adenosylhomocysteine hydrolase
MTESAADLETVKAELLKVDSLIGTAIRLLGEGRVVELTALEARTRQVCNAALALEGDDRKTLVPAMEALLNGLDKLTGDLNEKFGDLPALTSTVGADTASSAYGQALKHLVTESR